MIVGAGWRRAGADDYGSGVSVSSPEGIAPNGRKRSERRRWALLINLGIQIHTAVGSRLYHDYSATDCLPDLQQVIGPPLNRDITNLTLPHLEVGRPGRLHLDKDNFAFFKQVGCLSNCCGRSRVV